MDYQVIEFIRDTLSVKKLRLKDLTDEVSKNFDFKLTSSDLSFIHIQYRNTLIELWIEECLEMLKVKIDSNELSDDSIFELLTLFRSLHAFDGTPDYLQGEVYKLIKAEREIFTPKNFINSRMEISAFLKTTLTKLQENAKQDYEFYEILVQVLRNSYVYLNTLISTLKLNKFANGEASLYSISRNVLTHNFKIKHYDELKKVSSNLKHQRSPIEKTIKEMVKSYIEKLKSEEIISGGLKILKLRKKLLLSDDLENIVTPKDVVEIHIICDIFHIYKNLPKAYHGLNILVVSNIIKLHQASTWDLSGHDAIQKYSKNAGQLSNGDGKNGGDGEPGESGANCEIFSTEIINAELWTIISNGGNGSNGQDGGNGANGANGYGVQASDFKILGKRITKDNFINLLDQLKFSTEIGSRRMNYYDGGLEKQLIFNNDTVVAELLMLIRGTRGKVGALGGFGGFCGRAGYSGNIIINSESKGSKIISFNGSDGKNGNNGFNGRDGIDGGDACAKISSDDEIYKFLNQQKKLQFLASNVQETMSIFYKPTESYLYLDVMSDVIKTPQGEQLTLEEQKLNLKRDEKGLYDSINSVFKNANEKFSELSEKIKLQSYLNNDIDFGRFVLEIVKNQFVIYNYDILQSFAKFYTVRQLKIEQEVRDLLESFIKKSDLISESGELKITKKIVTTTDLNQISKNFDKLDVICDILHINSNLSKSFRGKNLTIHANKIIVHRNAVLDTSGIDYYPVYINQDQKYKDGGNVFIECDFIENASLLSIKSVGGDSSNLKDGIDPQADDFIINGKPVTAFPVENETYTEGNFIKTLVKNPTTSLLIVKGSDAPIIKAGNPGKIFIKSEEEIFKKEIKVMAENQQISDGRDIVMHVQNENVTTYGFTQNHKYKLMASLYELENSIEYEGKIYYPKLARVISKKTGIDDLELLDHLIWVLRNSYDKFDEVVEQLKLKELMAKNFTINQLVKLIRSENFDIGNYSSLVRCAENFVSNPAYHQLYSDTICEFTNTDQSTNSEKLIIKQKIYVSSQLDFLALDNDVTEIQIICDTIHIDSDLPESFRGRNLAIVAYYVQVHKTVTWDLSGLPLLDKNALPKAGKNHDGTGIDGQDGIAGNSGGNFSLYCKIIENPTGLTIKSNGSDGGDGQEGGDGRDGKDGQNATSSSFRKNGEEFKVFYEFSKASDLLERFGRSFVTDDGLQAYCYYGYERYFLFGLGHSAFMLVKGSDGEPGMSGGLPGYGGQGGFAGEISFNCDYDDMIKNVKKEVKSGNNGNMGKTSYNGASGRVGRDLYWHDVFVYEKAVEFGNDHHVKIIPVWNNRESPFIFVKASDSHVHMEKGNPIQRPLKTVNSSKLTRDREIFAKSKKNSPIDINKIHQDNSLFLRDSLSAIATQINQESSKAFKLSQSSKKNELTNFQSNSSKVSETLSTHDNIELRIPHNKLESIKKSDILVKSVINEYADDIKTSRDEMDKITKQFSEVESEIEVEQEKVEITTSVQLKFDKQSKISTEKLETKSRIFYSELLSGLINKIEIKRLQLMIKESRFVGPKYINLVNNMELYGIEPIQRKSPKNKKILLSILEKFIKQSGEQTDAAITKYARLCQNNDPAWSKCVDDPKVIKCLIESTSRNHPAFNVNYLKNAIENSTLAIDDVAMICSEKNLQKFYNQVYTCVNKEEFSIDENVSYISNNFVHQIKYLKDTGIFKSHSEKLDKHFRGGGDDEKTEILNYFFTNVSNFQIGLSEAVFNLLTDFANHIEEISNILHEYAQKIVKIQSEVEEIQEISYKVTSDAEKAVNHATKVLENTSKIILNPPNFFYSNNKKEKTKALMKIFFNNEKIIKFIKNDIQSNGISSQVYRKILFFKYNLKSVIFIEDNNENLIACENHNYPHDYWFQYNTSEDLLQQSEQHKELFLIYKDEKFSILELQSSKYKAFAKRQEVERSLKSVVGALKTDSNYPEYLKNVTTKFGITKNKFLRIFDVINPMIDVDTLAGIIISHFPLIVKKYDKNEVKEFTIDEMNDETVNDVVTEPDEEDLNPPHFEVVNDKKIRDSVKFNLTIIASLDGLSILYAIAIRLYNDKNSTRILDFGLITQVILSLILEGGSLSHLITFLILGNEPEHWPYELAIIKLENYFGIIDENLKTKWKTQCENVKNSMIMLTFLEKVKKLEDSKEKLTLEDLDEIFENIEYFGTNSIRNLKNSSLTSWKLMPTADYWKHQIEKLKSSENDKRFDNLKDVFEDMSSKYGSNSKDLVKILQNKKKELTNFNVPEFLSNFTTGEIKLNQKVLNDLSSTDISKWSDVIDQQKLSANVIRDAKKIVEIIKEDDEASPNVKAVIEEIGQNVRDIFKLICPKRNKKFMDYTEFEVKEWRKELSTPNVLECMAIITRSFQIMTDNKITLRDTQLMSILTMWRNNNGLLMQVSTGEGKTFIGVSFAILKVLHKENVDIITSSSVLAIRDAKENKKFFDFFGISVDHNCYDEPEKRKSAYTSQVVYGILGNFQRDFLLTSFYNQNFLSGHHFKNVLVDEVDSMLLDKGNNILYLSSELPDMDEIEGMFVYIWFCVTQHCCSNKLIAELKNTEKTKKIILDNCFGVVDADDIKQMDGKIDEQNIISKLNSHGIIDDNNLFRIKNYENFKFDEALKTVNDETREKIKFYCKTKIEKEKLIQFPGYLKEFVLLHIVKWIDSAIRALSLQNEKEYIIDRTNDGQDLSSDPKIIILDIDTGTDMTNSQWDEGLHQFLQLKHGCRLTRISLKSVFISNVSYFKNYKKLYGMTGTLGSLDERQKTTEIHKIDFVTIPRYTSHKFIEYPSIQAVNDNEWIDKIHSEVVEMFNKNRSTLVICETIQDTRFIEKELMKNPSLFSNENVHVYRRDSMEFYSKKLTQKHVIISTNLAGRGTDIKLSKELKDAGGLHVVLTYLPQNKRIENQAFGRASRAGDKGSGRLIISAKSNQTISEMKNLRNQNEIQRLDEINRYYKNFIIIEEKFFANFHKSYLELKLSFNSGKRQKRLAGEEYHVEDEPIVKIACLENYKIQFSFWLDRNSVHLKNWKNEDNFEHVSKSFELFIKQKPEIHPVKLIEIYNILEEGNKKDEAKKLLAKFPSDENDTSIAKAYTECYEMLSKNQSNKSYDTREINPEEDKKLRNCINLFESKIHNRNIQVHLITTLSEKLSKNLVKIEGFKKQQENMTKIDEFFIESIQRFLGIEMTPEQLSCLEFNVSIVTSELFKKLMEKGCIENYTIDVSEKAKVINDVAEKNFIDPEEMKKFLERNTKFDSIVNFEKNLRNTFAMPSREDFWNILKNNQILKNEKEYVFIDLKNLSDIDPSIFSKIPSKSVDISVTDKNVISLTEFVEKIDENTHRAVESFEFKRIFNMTDTCDRFKYLLNNNAIRLSKTAKFDFEQYKKIQIFKIFNNFTSISRYEFTNMGTSSETIFNKLINDEILIKRDDDKFNLNYEKFEDLKKNDKFLGEESVYHEKVKTLLNYKFSYIIALCDLSKKIERNITNSEDSITTQIHLNNNPSRHLLHELICKKIIKIPIVNANNIGKSEKIDKSELFKNEKIMIQSNHFEKAETLKSLENYAEAIVENKDKIFEMLKSKIPSLLNKDWNAVQVIKEPIEEVLMLKLGNPLTDEIMACVKTFKGKGLSFLINVKSKTYSLTYWLKILGLAAIIVVQLCIYVAFSICTGGIGMLLGSFFLNETISDLVYLGESLYSGEFSWAEYASHKWKSVLISVTSVLLGGFRANEVLNYSSKIFGKAFVKLGIELGKKIGFVLLSKTVSYLTGLLVKQITEGLSGHIKSWFEDDFFKKDGLGSYIDKLTMFVNKTHLTTFIQETYTKFTKSDSLWNFFLKQGISTLMKVIKKVLDSKRNQMFIWATFLATSVGSLAYLIYCYNTLISHFKEAVLKIVNRNNNKQEPHFKIIYDCNKEENSEEKSCWKHDVLKKISSFFAEKVCDFLISMINSLAFTGVESLLELGKDFVNKRKEKNELKELDKIIEGIPEDNQSEEGEIAMDNFMKENQEKLLNLQMKSTSKEVQAKLIETFGVRANDVTIKCAVKFLEDKNLGGAVEVKQNGKFFMIKGDKFKQGDQVYKLAIDTKGNVLDSQGVAYSKDGLYQSLGAQNPTIAQNHTPKDFTLNIANNIRSDKSISLTSNDFKYSHGHFHMPRSYKISSPSINQFSQPELVRVDSTRSIETHISSDSVASGDANEHPQVSQLSRSKTFPLTNASSASQSNLNGPPLIPQISRSNTFPSGNA